MTNPGGGATFSDDENAITPRVAPCESNLYHLSKFWKPLELLHVLLEVVAESQRPEVRRDNAVEARVVGVRGSARLRRGCAPGRDERGGEARFGGLRLLSHPSLPNGWTGPVIPPSPGQI